MTVSNAPEPLADPQSSRQFQISCVCGSEDGVRIGTLPFYMPNGFVNSNVFRCSKCGSLVRDINPSSDSLLPHFDVASYTRASNEPKARGARIPFFNWLISVFEDRGGRAAVQGGMFLDIGCAYGHLMEVIRNLGGCADGVEVVTHLRQSIAAKGFEVYSSLEHVVAAPPHRYDGVFLVDSLYLVQDPVDTLKQIRGLLKCGNSKILIRITNRAWLVRLRTHCGLGFTPAHFGDAKWCFSYRGIKSGIECAGFEVASVIWHERGKKGMRWDKWAYYQITGLLSLVGLRLTPGIILICKPRGPFYQTASS